MKKLLCKKLQIKSNDEFEGTFSGYASVFHVKDSYDDVVLPGAFTKTLEESKDVKLLWQHDPEQPIGVITNIYEAEKGLKIEGKVLTATSKGKEVYELLKSKSIDGLSIGYEVLDSYEDGDTRYITEVKLWEVSVVTFPANKMAKVEDVKDASFLQALDKAINEAKEFLNRKKQAQ